jgi:iron-sulfur cluster assembly accessory protein
MNDLNITLTDSAAKMISDTIEDQSVNDAYLAFYVAGGGCSGLQYGLALAEGEPEIDDIIVFDKNIKIAVDYSSAKYVNGAVIDYKEDGMQTGFKVENPNAAKTCGCSKSFSVEGEEYDTCGGCGYK